MTSYAKKRTRTAFENDIDIDEHQQPRDRRAPHLPHPPPPPSHAPYALFGTPLPNLEAAARDDGSYVPAWRQDVRDERGRRRLHGAFTGGWSAGYFNTVGSKEGWAPATFVSSRADKVRRKAEAEAEGEAKEGVGVGRQRVEDFMDEEDLRDREEARALETDAGFAGFAGESRQAAGVVDLLMSSGGNTVGAKLLRRMGWKDGQGIGPKVQRRARGDDDLDDGDGDCATHLFAPADSRIVAFVQKNDYKGLGYRGEARLDADKPEQGEEDDEAGGGLFGRLALRAPVQRERKAKQAKHPQRGGAFGVGVLNDTGSDEEDPYDDDLGPRISYNRTIGPEKKRKKPGTTTAADTSKLANPLVAGRPVFFSKKKGGIGAASGGAGSLAGPSQAGAGFRRCHDGRLPLDGFVLATVAAISGLSIPKKYAAPAVPPGWTPRKPGKTSANGNNNNNDYVSPADAARASTLDPAGRAQILGETPLPSLSIFDYISSADRDRIARVTGRTDLPAGRGEKTSKNRGGGGDGRRHQEWSLVPKLDRTTAAQALGRGWMPYAEDEDKQARYRAFLRISAGLAAGDGDRKGRQATDDPDEADLPPRAPGASSTDWVAELNEFARAAAVFRPMTGLMASRFTSSGTTQSAAENDGGGGGGGSTATADRSNRAKDPAAEAARLGMYGPGLTRSEQAWAPAALLCKRFNVPVPDSAMAEAADGAGAEAGESGGAGGGAGGSDTGGGGGGTSTTLGLNATVGIDSGGGGNSTRALLSRDAMDAILRDAAANHGVGPVLSGLEAGAETGMGAGDVTQQRQQGQQQQLPAAMAVVDPARNEALEGERAGAEVFRAVFGSDEEEEEEK